MAMDVTTKQATTRLVMYAVASFLTVFSPELMKMKDSGMYEWIVLALQCATPTIIAVGAYMDTSMSRVKPDVKD